MKTITTRFFDFITKSLWLTFLLNIYSLITIIEQVVKSFKKDETMWENIINALGVDDLIVFCVSIILYLLLRQYRDMKLSIEKYSEDINKAFSKITDNLNDSHRINHIKTRYLEFYILNKHLSNNEYIKELHENGFSKEDLEEIGVNEVFLSENKNRLLPKSVIEPFNKFKEEMDKHQNRRTES